MRAEGALESSDLFRQDVVMPGEDWERLGDYVVARRTALGMRDRRAVAAATGVTDRTLGKLENGRRGSPRPPGGGEDPPGGGPRARPRGPGRGGAGLGGGRRGPRA